MSIWIKNIVNFPFLAECNDENISEHIYPRIKLDKLSPGNFEIKFDFSENFDPLNPKFDKFDVVLENHGLALIYRPPTPKVNFPSYQIDVKIDRGNNEHMAFRRLILALNQYIEMVATDETSEFHEKVIKGYVEQIKDKLYLTKKTAYDKKKEPRGPEPDRNTEVAGFKISNPLYDGQFKNENGDTIKYSKFSHTAKFAGDGDSTQKSDKAKKAESKYITGQLMFVSPIKLVDPKKMVYNEKKQIEEPEVVDPEFKITKNMFKEANEPREFSGTATRIQTLKGNAKVARSGVDVSITYGPYILQMNICKREVNERNMDEL